MDFVWLQANWVIVTAAAGVALLLLILVIVALAESGRKRKAARAKASAGARSTGHTVQQPAAAKTTVPIVPAKPAQMDSSSSAESLFSKKPASATGPIAFAAAASVPATTAAVAPSVAPPAAPKERIVIHLGSTKPEDWKTPGGEQSSASPSPSGLRVAASTAAVSTVAMPTVPGTELVCDFEVRLVTQPANGAPVNFFVGPVVRDAAGKMISYWLEQPSFTPDQTSRKGSVEVTALEGAATVHVGVHGSWRPDGMHGDAAIEFTHLELRQK